MRVKKTKKPARSIRYLLSANPKLQRISLKKLSARGKRRVRRPRAARAKQEPVAAQPEIMSPVVQAIAPAPRAPEMHVQRATTPWGIALAVVVVTAAAVLVAVRQTSPAAETPKIDVRQDVAPPQPADGTELVVEKKPSPLPAPAKPRAAEPLVTAKPSINAEPGVNSEPVAKLEPVQKAEPVLKAEPVANAKPAGKAEPAVRVVPVEAPARVQPTALPPKAAASHAASVAITGCVARDEDTFWLKDTTGVDAPKARSWKSGFLKKRASSIELVDADHTLTLSSYVGQRVTATGTLADREMHARSLQRVASSCS